MLDSNLRVMDANPSFYKVFCVKPQETVGALIYDHGNGQWNIPRLKELLEKALPENTVYNDFEVEQEFETIGPKTMHLNARRIYREPNHENIIEKSDALKYVLYKTEQIAASDTTVMILCKTGTGKELMARAVHGFSK